MSTPLVLRCIVGEAEHTRKFVHGLRIEVDVTAARIDRADATSSF
jgi:hypothetical protein